MTFIVGCPRSGTTWLGRMYQRHPKAIVTVEASFLSVLLTPWWEMPGVFSSEPESPAPPTRKDRLLDVAENLLFWNRPRWFGRWRKHLESYFDDRTVFLRQHWGLGGKTNEWGELREELVGYRDLCALIEEAERKGYATHEQKAAHIARAAYRRFYDRRGGTPEHVLVDKSPPQLLHAELILEHFPDAKIIEAVRDGRDVCVSMDAYKAYMPQNRKVQVTMWKSFAAKGLELRRDPAWRERILEVRYEDTKRDPIGQIRRMFEFSGLAVSQQEAEAIAAATDISKVKDIGEGQHVRKGAVGDFRERFSAEDLELFREMAGEVLEARGYAW
jgi:hypothetical protein